MLINYSVSSHNSLLSDKVKIGLAISAGVAIFIAIIGLIFTLIYKKRIKNKYITPDEQIELEKLKIKNPNYGIVLNGIKKYYENLPSDFLVAFLVNTIYLNDYKNIFIVDQDDYLTISISNLCNLVPSLIPTQNLEKLKYDEISNVEVSLKISKYNITNNEDKNPKNDMYIIMDETLNFNDILNIYIPLLNNREMLVISYQNLNDILAKKEYFKNNNIKYETINFDNKNVILLAKDNLKAKFNEDRKGL